jgi:hypothetical protein
VVFETEVEQTANGRSSTRLLRYVENGIDVTEDQRAVIENIAGPDTSQDGHRSDLTRPSGDTADRYLFGEPELFGSEVVVDFEPAPGHEDDTDLAEGRLAWDPDTLDPIWMELTAVHPPPPLKQLSVRFEFAKLEDLTVVVRKVTDGLAKVQMMQREFHTDLRFDDLRPAE